MTVANERPSKQYCYRAAGLSSETKQTTAMIQSIYTKTELNAILDSLLVLDSSALLFFRPSDQ